MAIQFSPEEILETIRMVQMEKLDIRTITLGISLRDCAHPDLTATATRARTRPRSMKSTANSAAGSA